MAKPQRDNPPDAPVPLASSEALGWQPLLVEEFQQPPSETDIPETWESHSVALCLAPRPLRIHQAVGDRRYTGLYTKGDISITPAHIPASFRAEGEDHYLHVQIPAQFLQSIARSTPELDPDRLQLSTQFRFRDPQLEQVLLLLRAELHKGNGWVNQLYIESLANVLAISLLRDYSAAKPRIAEYEGGLGDRKILQLSDYIQAHLTQPLKLADLAEVVGISPYHFSRLFKQSMGVTPHQYVLQQRVAQAQQMLKNTPMAIAEVALACGFNSQSHLTKRFRDTVGVTPSAYRKG